MASAASILAARRRERIAQTVPLLVLSTVAGGPLLVAGAEKGIAEVGPAQAVVGVVIGAVMILLTPVAPALAMILGRVPSRPQRSWPAAIHLVYWWFIAMVALGFGTLMLYAQRSYGKPWFALLIFAYSFAHLLYWKRRQASTE